MGPVSLSVAQGLTKARRLWWLRSSCLFAWNSGSDFGPARSLLRVLSVAASGKRWASSRRSELNCSDSILQTQQIVDKWFQTNVGMDTFLCFWDRSSGDKNIRPGSSSMAKFVWTFLGPARAYRPEWRPEPFPRHSAGASPDNHGSGTHGGVFNSRVGP